jgi:hypothetical protein
MIETTSEISYFLERVKSINQNDNPYMSYEYYQVFSKYNKPKDFLCLLVYDDNNILKGLLPLQKTRFCYQIYGHRASNYLGYISKPEDIEFVDSEIKNFLSNSGKDVIINYYDINDSTKDYVILDNDNNAVKIPLYICPFVDVNKDFEDLFKEKITKKKKRTEFKKFDTRLNLVGNVQLINIEDAESFEKYKGYITQIYSVHEERFSNVYIPEEFCLYKNEEYYTELLKNMVMSKKVLLSMLLIDDVVVSFLYTLVSDGVVIDWMPAFDPAFSKYSLGSVHLIKLMKYLCASPNYRVLDFSKGGGVYKDRWATGITKNYMFIRKFNNGFISRIKQNLIIWPYKMKSYLRDLGLLSKIKNLLGKIEIKKKSVSDINVKVDPSLITKDNVSEDYEKVNFKYKYVKEFSVEYRKKLLDSIYQNENVFLYLKNNKVIYAYIQKDNSEIEISK